MLSVDGVPPAIKKLPPHLQVEAINYISSLTEQSENKSKRAMEFKWAGCAEDIKDRYTSSELQIEDRHISSLALVREDVSGLFPLHNQAIRGIQTRYP